MRWHSSDFFWKFLFLENNKNTRAALDVLWTGRFGKKKTTLDVKRWANTISGCVKTFLLDVKTLGCEKKHSFWKKNLPGWKKKILLYEKKSRWTYFSPPPLLGWTPFWD